MLDRIQAFAYLRRTFPDVPLHMNKLAEIEPTEVRPNKKPRYLYTEIDLNTWALEERQRLRAYAAARASHEAETAELDRFEALPRARRVEIFNALLAAAKDDKK